MKITKEGDELVVRLPLTQKENNSYFIDENQGRLTDNLIGVIAGDEYTISQLNDLSYKGDQQEGEPYIHYYGSKEDFIKLCESLGLVIWNHPICVACDRPIYGSCTWDGGPVCYQCGLDNDKDEKVIKKNKKNDN